MSRTDHFSEVQRQRLLKDPPTQQGKCRTYQDALAIAFLSRVGVDGGIYAGSLPHQKVAEGDGNAEGICWTRHGAEWRRCRSEEEVHALSVEVLCYVGCGLEYKTYSGDVQKAAGKAAIAGRCVTAGGSHIESAVAVRPR